MINPPRWPQRWGLVWIAAACVWAAGAVVLHFGPRGPEPLVVLLLVLSFVCLARSAYWRGYRHGYIRANSPATLAERNTP